jgi:hypothetical protein
MSTFSLASLAAPTATAHAARLARENVLIDRKCYPAKRREAR